MNRSFPFAVAVLTGLASCVVVDIANAQLIRRRVPLTQPTNPVVQNEQASTLHDVFLANWIAVDNQTEIQLNQFAGQRAASQEVKDFSQEMIRAHSDLANKLNQTISNPNAASAPASGQVPYTAGYRGAAGNVTTAPGNASQPETPSTGPVQANPAPAAPGGPTVPAAGNSLQPGAPQPTRPVQANTVPAAPGGPSVPAAGNSLQPGGPQPGTGNAGNLENQNGAMANISGNPNASSGTMPRMNPVGFKRDINGELAKIVEQRLGQKKNQDFDRCFMEGQIACHTNMLATLEAARNQASPQLKSVLDEAVGVTERHLAQAESILAKLQQAQGPR